MSSTKDSKEPLSNEDSKEDPTPGPSQEARPRKHKKVLKISPSIFGRCSSNELNAASQDNPIPGPSQETNPKKTLPFMCPKCLRIFDSGTELVEHLHDHENTGKDRKFRCKMCNTEKVVAYFYYEGYYHGDPNRRVIGMHCEDCLKKIFCTDMCIFTFCTDKE